MTWASVSVCGPDWLAPHIGSLCSGGSSNPWAFLNCETQATVTTVQSSHPECWLLYWRPELHRPAGKHEPGCLCGTAFAPRTPSLLSDSKVFVGLPGLYVPEALTARPPPEGQYFLRNSGSWPIGEEDPVRWLFGNVVSVTVFQLSSVKVEICLPKGS